MSLDSIIEYDNRCFVAKDLPSRRRLLQLLFQIPGSLGLVATDKTSGKIVGLACRRPCAQNNSHRVGPLYADDDVIAESLLRALCQHIAGDCVTICSW